MSVFLFWIDIIWDTFWLFFALILNIKVWEYGQGDDYLTIRVSHIFWPGFVVIIVFFVLTAYFKRKGSK